MNRMLVVVFNDWEIDSDGPAFDDLSKESLNIAVGGNCADPLPNNVPDSLSSPTGWLPQCGCDCHVATCLSEAASLLGEQHFDVVLFDLDIFDGKTHRLISQLNDSTASLFSCLDVEDGCWWLPAGIPGKGLWETQTLWTKSSDQLLKEIYGHLVSRVHQISLHDSAVIEQQLPDTHSPKLADGEAILRDRHGEANPNAHRAKPVV